jgi:hypothetical protein
MELFIARNVGDLQNCDQNMFSRSTIWSRQMAGDTCFCTIDYNLEDRNPKLVVVFLPDNCGT